ncbi:radical SAM protein [Candidatus Woesearchaeota archaeon]|nr:radical SAM protein [Candidatus Woesearchaeota archaeon]
MLETTRKSLLYKSSVEYADFCINHVEGCSHGCKFPCYAFQMSKRWGKVRTYEDWLKPKLVVNALELLNSEIPKYKDQIKFVHLSFMTDPFMYKQKKVKDMTLKIIEKLNKNNIKCTVLTKGIYPKTLENKERYTEKNEYGITLVSINENFRKGFEPGSSPYEDRINSLRYLHEKGLKTWVSIEPYPTPNLDTNQNFSKLLKKISFVDKIVFGKLNYNVQSTQFKNNKEFYEECASKVIEFCQKKGIDYHIKFGTQKEYNKNTSTMFKRVCSTTT